MPGPAAEMAGLWPLVAAFLGGYLLGSVPFGLLVARVAGKGDIRAAGSGNIGATNVSRVGGKRLGALTLLLDAAKGALPALVAARWGAEGALVAAAGAVLGHVFPVWLRFRGGKGVATALGAMLAVAWPVGLLACATWLAVGALFRYSSVASLAAFAALPFYAWWLTDSSRAWLATGLSVLVILRHHNNIRRLLDGTETRV